MKVGTKSALWGVHCIFWHPIPIALAWRKLYGAWPRWHEWIAIFFHDFPGYWGKPNMDGPEGETHPERGAEWTGTTVKFLAYWGWRLRGKQKDTALFLAHIAGANALQLALFHSRFYAARYEAEPSKLCWADKLSVHYEPAWWYLLRAHASGEVREYVRNAPLWVQVNSRVWFDWYLRKVTEVVNNRRKAQSRYV